MKHIRICTVVTGKTIDEFLINLEKIQKLSSFVELRVDYINDVSEKDILRIREKTTKTSIFTCRSEKEGGLYKKDESQRITFIKKAVAMGFDYIDIELSAIKQFTFSDVKGVKVILSFHNFESTPSLQKLKEIKEEMKKYSPFCMKIATKIKSNKDFATLVQFLIEKQKSESIIAIGMGEKGKALRVLGPLLGSYLTFAATPYSQSAREQLRISELKTIYAIMEGEKNIYAR